jgi:nitroreductase
MTAARARAILETRWAFDTAKSTTDMTTKNDLSRIPAVIRAVAEAARAAPSADNLQPVGLRYRENELVLRHRELKVPTFPARHPATLLAVGAAVENVAQAATAMDIESHIRAMAEPPDFFASIHLEPGAKPIASRIETHRLFERHTNRYPYHPAPIGDALIAELAEMREERTRIQLLGQPGEIRALASFTQIASEARFRTSEIHAWFAASLRFTPGAAAQGDGLDVRTFDLPAGGRLLLHYIADWRRLERLNRFRAYRILAAIEARPIRRAPLLIAIVGDNPFSAGRLMQRTWIRLNAQGIAVQPFYVIPDQIQRLRAATVPSPLRDSVGEMANDVQSMLGLRDPETLQMVLRVGRPTRKPFRAARLPLEHLLLPA